MSSLHLAVWSVGEADFVKEVVESLGEVGFWKVAMKPGRPLAFGKIGDTRFFGLPGNPVSVMVTYYQFVEPALVKMSGGQHRKPVRNDRGGDRAIEKTPRSN